MVSHGMGDQNLINMYASAKKCVTCLKKSVMLGTEKEKNFSISSMDVEKVSKGLVKLRWAYHLSLSSVFIQFIYCLVWCPGHNIRIAPLFLPRMSKKATRINNINT
jgi:hypothetical protein